MLKRKDENNAAVQTLLRGSSSELKAFFDEYFSRLYRFTIVRVSGEHEVAKEIVQTTLSKIVMNIRSFKGDATLFTWMCSICSNEISDHLKKQGRFDSVIELQGTSAELDSIPTSGLVAGPERPDTVFDRDQRTLSIHETLDRLPTRYGDVLEWKYIEGLSVSEIADRLSLPHSAAQSLLYRARMAFQTLYKDRVS